jgi:predicted esterase
MVRGIISVWALLLLFGSTDLFAQNGTFKTKSGLSYTVAHAKPGGRPQGVMFCFHGQGGSAGQAMGMFGGAAKAHGWIAIAPQNTQDAWQTSQIRDFIEMLDVLAEQTAIDYNRIHTAGHSAGAGIAFGFAISAPDLIASAGVFNGSFPQGGMKVAELNPQEAAKDVPIFWSVGKNDNQIHFRRVQQLYDEYKALGFDKIELKTHGGGHQPNQAHIAEWTKWVKTKRKPFQPGENTELSWTAGAPDDLAFAEDRNGLVVIYVYHSEKHRDNDDASWLESGIFANEELKAKFERFACVKEDLATSDAWMVASEAKAVPALIIAAKTDKGLEFIKVFDAAKVTPKAVNSALKKAAKKVGQKLD